MTVSTTKIKLISVALTAALVLSACGQKGPLYLPSEPTSNQPTEGAELPTDSAEQG